MGRRQRRWGGGGEDEVEVEDGNGVENAPRNWR